MSLQSGWTVHIIPLLTAQVTGVNCCIYDSSTNPNMDETNKKMLIITPSRRGNLLILHAFVASYSNIYSCWEF